MPAFSSIEIQSRLSRGELLARLQTALIPAKSFSVTNPATIGELVDQYRDKVFVGEMSGNQFKMMALGSVGPGIRWRGGGAILTGELHDHRVVAHIRPPLASLLFGALFITAAVAAQVFVCLGPADTVTMHLLLGAMLFIPLAVLVLAYRHDKGLAIKRLRKVFAGLPGRAGVGHQR